MAWHHTTEAANTLCDALSMTHMHGLYVCTYLKYIPLEPHVGVQMAWIQPHPRTCSQVTSWDTRAHAAGQKHIDMK